MKRKNKVLETTKEIMENGEKATVNKISERLGWPPQDIHRCVNILEKNGDIKTHRKTVFGEEHRFISVIRK